jgi:invasion protein IalB
MICRGVKIAASAAALAAVTGFPLGSGAVAQSPTSQEPSADGCAKSEPRYAQAHGNDRAHLMVQGGCPNKQLYKEYIERLRAPLAAPKVTAAAAAPTPAAGPVPPAASQSAWIKVCEKAQVLVGEVDKTVCLVLHEKIDGNTGLVIVSAAIRQIQGDPKQTLLVMVPSGMDIVPGLRAAVYTKAMWEKAQANEKINDGQLQPFDLKFQPCHAVGCTAEVDASADLVDNLKTGGGLMVFATNKAAQEIAFPVPLNGFAAALAGPSISPDDYYAPSRSYPSHTRTAEQQRRDEQLYKEYIAQQKASGKLPNVVPAPAKR